MNALRFIYLLSMLLLIVLINFEAFVMPLLCAKEGGGGVEGEGGGDDVVVSAFQSPAGL